jgi:hypothetical protein
MKVGDTKQVAVLGVVAVLAIGFLIYRLLPSREVAVRSAVAAATAAGSSSRDLGLQLVRDPFSSERLSLRSKPASSDAQESAQAAPKSGNQWEVQGGKKINVKPDEFPNALVGSLPGGGLPMPVPEDHTPVNRRKETGEVTATLFRLDATMNAGEPKAMISVNGADARMFQAGDTVGPQGHVVTVDDSGVEISVGGKRIRLAVGEEKHV